MHAAMRAVDTAVARGARNIRLFVDNTAAIAAIKRGAMTKNDELSQLGAQLKLTHPTVTVLVEYISTHDNPADGPSRLIALDHDKLLGTLSAVNADKTYIMATGAF